MNKGKIRVNTNHRLSTPKSKTLQVAGFFILVLWITTTWFFWVVGFLYVAAKLL
jgi:hypothetical protein